MPANLDIYFDGSVNKANHALGNINGEVVMLVEAESTPGTHSYDYWYWIMPNDVTPLVVPQETETIIVDGSAVTKRFNVDLGVEEDVVLGKTVMEFLNIPDLEEALNITLKVNGVTIPTTEFTITTATEIVLNEPITGEADEVEVTRNEEITYSKKEINYQPINYHYTNGEKSKIDNFWCLRLPSFDINEAEQWSIGGIYPFGTSTRTEVTINASAFTPARAIDYANEFVVDFGTRPNPGDISLEDILQGWGDTTTEILTSGI